MRNISIALFVSTFLFASPVMAGVGHEHGPDGGHSQGPINSQTAIKKAEKQVKSLVERGRLEKSWADAKATGATQKAFAQGGEWVVTFSNNKVSDTSKQTLYVFYTLDGTYIASNFTGK